MKRILMITGGRADWGLLFPVAQKIRAHSSLELVLLATGQHIVSGSLSLAALEADGFSPQIKVDMKLGECDDPKHLSHAMGRALSGVGDAISTVQPDAMLVLGDRYEILAAVSAALLAQLPVVHLCGGDETLGAFDDNIRHAITKLSAWHLVSNQVAAEVLLRLGESSDRVHVVGSPGIDRILSIVPDDLTEFADLIGLRAYSTNFVITYHPATRDEDPLLGCRELLATLAAYPDTGMLFCGSNADPGGRAIDRLIDEFVVSRDNAVSIASLGANRFATALNWADCMIGNSSAGLYEAPSYGLPTVNIGNRQDGRLRAASVFDCANHRDAIDAALKAALRHGKQSVANPYGDGKSADRIVDHLVALDLAPSLNKKPGILKCFLSLT